MAKKKQKTPVVYDETKTPPYFKRDYWLNSHLSIVRYYGACNFNGVRYELDELTEDLCREDVAKARRAAYTKQDLATIKAKYDEAD